MALATAVGLTAAVAPSAQAAFTTPFCGGSSITGRGATFQAGAQSGFTQNFHSVFVCGAGGRDISYEAAGSGPGRAAFGEGGGVRDPNIRFIAFDEAPTTTQRGQIEGGATGTTGDEGSLHVIPAAIGSIPIIVNFPANCAIPGARQDKPDPSPGNLDDAQATQRFLAGSSLTGPTGVNATWEAAWRSDATVATWGQLVPGITDIVAGTNCATKPIKRIVRSSSSGTTFAFKKWLKSVNPTFDWQEPELGNTSWPAGVTPVTTASGNAGIASLVAATDGSIGYGDLKSDRDGGFSKTKCLSPCAAQPTPATAPSADRTFWVRTVNGGSQLQDPQKETLGYKDNSLTGANCDQATITGGIPAGADPTLGDWSQISAAASSAGYAICAPTYMGVWDDASTVYGNTQAEQDKFRTVVDYARSIISPGGQATLSGRDYNSLPPTLLGAAATGVNALDWNKAGGGGGIPPGGGGGTVTPPPSGGGATTTPPPPVATASMSIASATVASNGTVTLACRVSGPGTLSGTETASVSAKDFKSAKNKTLTVAKVSLRVSSAGTYKLVFKLSAKAKRILAKRRKLKVSIKVTFTPVSGNPVTRTVTLTIKAKKKK